MFDIDVSGDSWMSDALCLEYPRDWWFPSRGEPIDRARDVCRRCLVQRECLTLAIVEGLDQGIFGGTSPKDRRRLRVQRVPLDEVLDAAESRLQRERRARCRVPRPDVRDAG